MHSTRGHLAGDCIINCRAYITEYQDGVGKYVQARLLLITAYYYLLLRLLPTTMYYLTDVCVLLRVLDVRRRLLLYGRTPRATPADQVGLDAVLVLLWHVQEVPADISQAGRPPVA